MDTREKIIDSEKAAARATDLRRQGTSLRVVTGHFDVLVTEHIRRLSEIARGADKLFVVVLDPPVALLSARARAELVASLAMVDYVVPIGEQASEQWLSSFTAKEIVREESADLVRADRLKQHVQRRNQQ